LRIILDDSPCFVKVNIALFWTLTIDAHLVRATIEWCKVFGSNNNPTHWKKLSVAQSEVLWNSFLGGLFQATGLDEQDWRQYRKSIVDFRNKFVAHRELHFSEPVPGFDNALAATYYYDNWVRKIISPDKLGEPSLESLARTLKQSLTPSVDKLLRVTESM
jgi:hypothetical protein